MQKILLVYDDFTEMMETHNGLKKVGFDVVAVTNEMSTADEVISLNPDLVIAFGRGQKVSSLGVGKRLKDLVRWRGKSVLILPKDLPIRTDDILKIRVDQLLEAPVLFESLLIHVCRMFKHDEKAMLAKLHRTFSEEETNITIVGSNPGAGSDPKAASAFAREMEDHRRQNRLPKDPGLAKIHRELEEARTQERRKVQKYLEISAKEPIKASAGIQRKDARARLKEMGRDWKSADLRDLDEERQAFVKAMFQKKPAA